MKRIALRVLPDPHLPNQATTAIATETIIRDVIRQPKDRQNGATIDEIRRGIRILNALDLALETPERVLVLEDADYAELREKTLATKWFLIDQRMLSIIESILDAQETLTLNDQHAADWALAAAHAVDQLAN